MWTCRSFLPRLVVVSVLHLDKPLKSVCLSILCLQQLYCVCSTWHNSLALSCSQLSSIDKRTHKSSTFISNHHPSCHMPNVSLNPCRAHAGCCVTIITCFLQEYVFFQSYRCHFSHPWSIQWKRTFCLPLMSPQPVCRRSYQVITLHNKYGFQCLLDSNQHTKTNIPKWNLKDNNGFKAATQEHLTLHSVIFTVVRNSIKQIGGKKHMCHISTIHTQSLCMLHKTTRPACTSVQYSHSSRPPRCFIIWSWGHKWFSVLIRSVGLVSLWSSKAELCPCDPAVHVLQVLVFIVKEVCFIVWARHKYLVRRGEESVTSRGANTVTPLL